jgi:ABC-type multidrug transport system permease subunit
MSSFVGDDGQPQSSLQHLFEELEDAYPAIAIFVLIASAFMWFFPDVVVPKFLRFFYLLSATIF